MRTFAALALATAAVFSTAAQAAPANVPPADSTVQIRGEAPRVEISESTFEHNFSGQYRLANGKKLTVSAKNDGYYAHIQGQREVKIVPTSSKSFASTNNRVELIFEAQPGSDVVVGVRN